MSYNTEVVSLRDNPYFIIFWGLVSGIFMSLVVGLSVIGDPNIGLIISISIFANLIIGFCFGIFIGSGAGYVFISAAILGTGLGTGLCLLIKKVYF